jgi:hypothetical protein
MIHTGDNQRVRMLKNRDELVLEGRWPPAGSVKDPAIAVGRLRGITPPV